MEKLMNEIRAKAELLNAYAEVLKTLDDRMRWYQHTEKDENGDQITDADGNPIWIDDDGDYAKAYLSAYRETIKAVRKLAGV